MPKRLLKEMSAYRSYWKMMRRCYDKSSNRYYLYGAKGIKVCAEWKGNPWAFIDYMGDRPDGMSLDRKDSSGNYEPGNVRWADANTQNQNRSCVVLNKAMVESIRNLRAKGFSYKDIKHELDLDASLDTISMAGNGTSWTNVKIASRPKLFNSRIVEYNGEALLLREWSNRIGIAYSTLHARIYRHRWTPERALTTDTNGRKLNEPLSPIEIKPK